MHAIKVSVNNIVATKVAEMILRGDSLANLMPPYFTDTVNGMLLPPMFELQ